MSTERLRHHCGALVDHIKVDAPGGFAYDAVFRNPQTNTRIEQCPECDAQLYAELVHGNLSPQPPAITGKE